jgi:secretion/DNA translocation related TadE-like protein
VTRDGRGSVTPLVLGGIGMVVLSLLLTSIVGGALVALRRTQAAADLAALAGAVAFQGGRDACAAAERSANLNDATLAECVLTGQVVAVKLTSAAPPMFGHELVVRAYARAGPR